MTVFIPSNVKDGYFLTNFTNYEDNKFTASIDIVELLEFIVANSEHINFNTLIATFFSKETHFRGANINGPVVSISDVEIVDTIMCHAFIEDSTIKPFRQTPSFLTVKRTGNICKDDIFIFNVGKYLWHLCKTGNLQNDNGLAVTCYSTLSNESIRQLIRTKLSRSTIDAISCPNSFPHMFAASDELYDALFDRRIAIYNSVGFNIKNNTYNFTINPSINIKNSFEKSCECDVKHNVPIDVCTCKCHCKNTVISTPVVAINPIANHDKSCGK